MATWTGDHTASGLDDGEDERGSRVSASDDAPTLSDTTANLKGACEQAGTVIDVADAVRDATNCTDASACSEGFLHSAATVGGGHDDVGVATDCTDASACSEGFLHSAATVGGERHTTT